MDEHLAARFRSMQDSGPVLLSLFQTLTRAHAYFQGSGELKTVSISDVLDNGCIEATFQGVHLNFVPLPVFGANRHPRGRVIVMHCHATYGKPAQELLGSFTYGEDGVTDLDPDDEGNHPHLREHAPEIILRFFDAAFVANKLL